MPSNPSRRGAWPRPPALGHGAIGLLLLLLALAATPAAAQPNGFGDDDAAAAPSPDRKAAIFVKNKAPEVPDEKVAVLEDQLSALVADRGLNVIRREDVLNAVSRLADAGPNVGGPEGEGERLDQMLSDNTSALRLAQAMDADYLLMASMSSFEVDEAYSERLQFGRRDYTLRTSVSVLGRVTGSARTGDVIVATIREPMTANVRVKSAVIDKLVADTAKQAAQFLAAKAQSDALGDPEAMPDDVPYFINATMADLSFPEVVRDESGQYVVTANNYQLQAFGVVVEANGIVVGSTPGPLDLAPGLNNLRLRRAGFEDWTGRANVRPGRPLTVAMIMTDDFRDQFMETAGFMQELKAGEKLTDAQVEMMKGYAEFLRNSEVKIGADEVNVYGQGVGDLPDFLSGLTYGGWLEETFGQDADD